jgi:1-acyl-sn-glycerol-3-phosphate acyltransferase
MSPSAIIPGQFSARFAAGFGWYVRRMLRKSFHAVRLESGSGGVLGGLAGHIGPVVVPMSHASWWDPLIAVLLGRAFLPERSACGPMDREQLAKFGFFRRLGLFGIDPDSAESMAAMRGYVAERFATEKKPTLWLTPQGRFADVRAEIELRPGAAAIAAAAPECRVVAMAIEYGFWLDKRPEVFVRCAPVEPAKAAVVSTADWQRALVSTMRENAAALAQLVIARDPSAFEVLLGGGGRINPVYDAWLRLRGRSGSLQSARLQADRPGRKAAA